MISINLILFIMGMFVVLLMLYMLSQDMPDLEKSHHDSKKGSFSEISNRKE